MTSHYEVTARMVYLEDGSVSERMRRNEYYCGGLERTYLEVTCTATLLDSYPHDSTVASRSRFSPDLKPNLHQHQNLNSTKSANSQTSLCDSIFRQE